MTPLVEARSLEKTFDAQQVLLDASLTIDRGQAVALIGASGSGKSTLLNLLGLLDTPTSGRLTFQGRDVTFASAAERASLRSSSLGFVFQSFQLLNHRSVLDNVQMGALYSGRRRRSRVRAHELLDRVGLAEKHSATTATLSGGERQRVAIARALVNEPALLLCDEPTGNLDTQSRDVVLDLLLRERTPDVAVVVVTHDEFVANRCDRRLRVCDGRVTIDEL